MSDLAEKMYGRTLTEIEELTERNVKLVKGIQDYLDGNWGTRLPSKLDKCPHGHFGWEDCGNCIDEYFAALLQQSTEKP